MNLYSKFADKFSSTRQIPWEGWKLAIPHIKNLDQPIRVLDLGCGNGRFLKFLITNHELLITNYCGIDNSAELLQIADSSFEKKEFKTGFINKDLNSDNWNEDLEKFDLIVGFGLMHHLESTEVRQKLIQKAESLLSENGLLIISYWMFKENESFMKKHLIKDLSNNDFILSFAKDAERFCHYSSEEEIESLYKPTNLKHINSYRSDGFNNKMNLYKVYKT